MTPDRWLRRFHGRQPGAPRLVCLPHAGGAASAYFALSATLSPDVELVAVQYPGRQDRRREPFVTDIHAMAACVVEALLALDDLRAAPLALFGHSMGASVAFEAARLLEHRQRIPVTALFVSARRAPSPVRSERVLTDTEIVNDLRRLGGTDTTFLDDPVLFEAIMPAIRNDYAAVMRYVFEPGPPLTCPIIAIVGDIDPYLDVGSVAGWAAVTAWPFDVHVVHGGHFHLPTSLAAVARLVRDAVRCRRVVGSRAADDGPDAH